MRTLIIDMPNGVAGDMLLGALAALGGDLRRVESDLLALGVGAIPISARTVTRSGIAAVLVDVGVDQQATWSTGAAPAAAGATPALKGMRSVPVSAHGHRPYRAIRDLLAAAALPARVVERAQRVFRLLAEAEAEVHGTTPESVEFHEVGALDAIADVVGCCLLLEQLGIGRVLAGPLVPGEGHVDCAHGRMPVPVPAVAAMLARTRAPHRRLGRETGELTTPTGCALVCALADAWLDERSGTLAISRVGYGAGHRDPPGVANVVRCSLVDAPADGTDGSADGSANGSDRVTDRDEVAELRCQVDDATGEQLAVLVEELLAAGAHDAWLAPIVMKKGRPGTAIGALCAVGDRERIGQLLLARSPSIGLRWQRLSRMLLPRRQARVEVRGMGIALKIVTLPDGRERAKPEADDVGAAARALGLDFATVSAAALAAWAARRDADAP